VAAEQSSSNETAREHLGQPTPALPIDQGFTILKWMELVFFLKKKGNMEQLVSPCSAGHLMWFEEGSADSASLGFLFFCKIKIHYKCLAGN